MQIFAYSDQEKLLTADQAIKGIDYRCPSCGDTLRLKRGPYRQDHFFHLREANCRLTQKGALHLKIQLQLMSQIPSLQLEASFPAINRIADLYWPEKNQIFEIQCSPISVNEALSRNRDYAKLGLTVIWILYDGTFKQKSMLEDILPYIRYTDGHTIYPNSRKQPTNSLLQKLHFCLLELLI